MIAVTNICGVGRIPKDRTAAGKWLIRNGIRLDLQDTKGGVGHCIDPATLPKIERIALLRRAVEAVPVPAGIYDDDAHRAFEDLPEGVQKKGEYRASIARFIATRGITKLSADAICAVREEFGESGTGESTLRRIIADIEGIDPINWAPALAPKHKGRTVKAETSDEAWQWFLSLLNEAAPNWPVKAAWGRVKRDAKGKGWAWPSYATINRRWLALTERERTIIRFGQAEADKRFYQPILRDPTSLKSLDTVSLDGRTLDIFADFGDGVKCRPIMIALTDCASGKLLDFVLSPTENADRTRDLIINTCEVYGAFDKLYTDNGSAFAGHVISGRTKYKFRNGKNRDLVRERPGVCVLLGIDIVFALPGNGQAKIAERKFRDFSRQVDDAPEFAGAHAGHNPGERKKNEESSKVIPVPIETVEAIYRREIAAYNAEPGRRSGACGGKLSYDDAFARGNEGRTPRVLTARQIKLARLDYKAVTVDMRGQFKIGDWVYGDLKSQDALMRYEGRKIFAGYDPHDMTAPVIAYGAEDDRLIFEGIPAIEKGAYNSQAGKELAGKQRATARKHNRKAAKALQLIPAADVSASLGIRPANAMPTDEEKEPSKVVQGTFKTPLRSGTDASKEQKAEPVPGISADDWDDMAEQILANARKANVRSGHS